MCVLIKNTTQLGVKVQLRFELSQHAPLRPPARGRMALGRGGDTQLMKNLIQHLNCGYLTKPKEQDYVRIYVTKFSDIIEIIIPLFRRSPIQGSKKADYNDFCKIAELIGSGAHSTQKGL